MALTNYISQSLFGILIYYGIGLGVGLSMGLYEPAIEGHVIRKYKGSNQSL